MSTTRDLDRRARELAQTGAFGDWESLTEELRSEGFDSVDKMPQSLQVLIESERKKAFQANRA
jgi:hypothetical protein